jgi:DNA-binding CsgD family transcriptional regulator
VAAVLPAHPTPAPELAPLELEVLRGAAAGERVAETSGRLHYSEGYVWTLRRRACTRLGAGTVSGAVAAAFRYGLLR